MALSSILKTGLKGLWRVSRGTPWLRADVEWFPPADAADAEGVVAVGGDLAPERVLAAYRRGIFPWAYPGEPLLWRSPDPRFVLDLTTLHVPGDVKRLLRKAGFEVRFDSAFEQAIICAASVPRPAGEPSWIGEETIRCFVELHRRGLAHSCEVFRDGRLVGGSYGLALGRVFFSESTFTLESGAGNVSFASLMLELRARGFLFDDAQVRSNLVARFGGAELPRAGFLKRLSEAVALEASPAPWTTRLWTGAAG